MNTKSEYPVTDSITNVVEASIVTASVMALIACEVTRHMGHTLEGGVYKGVKSSWGLVKGAKDRLVSYKESISEKVNKARAEAVAANEEATASAPVQPPVDVPDVLPAQPHVEEAPTPAGMPTPAFA